ncbi:hypothetical protein BDV98DRAFT_53266 [Pterulicium gracile]|uniref:Uncharacterized protein n=1 Tax=Pterulicium gracile TaxID=1884261 RepID=A0A5C3QK57_9AGAR|nr:hypothetical protein BDV98DRAFT_53266 [Pterula gracilis]
MITGRRPAVQYCSSPRRTCFGEVISELLPVEPEETAFLCICLHLLCIMVPIVMRPIYLTFLNDTCFSRRLF